MYRCLLIFVATIQARPAPALRDDKIDLSGFIYKEDGLEQFSKALYKEMSAAEKATVNMNVGEVMEICHASLFSGSGMGIMCQEANLQIRLSRHMYTYIYICSHADHV